MPHIEQSILKYGGQVPRHHKPSSRPHARLVAQFMVHERFMVLGSHYPHLRTPPFPRINPWPALGTAHAYRNDGMHLFPPTYQVNR